MSATKRFQSLKPAGIMIFVGVAFIGAYKILAHYRIGDIGAPTDIGGGFIPLTGLGLVFVGIADALLVLVARLWRRVRNA